MKFTEEDLVSALKRVIKSEVADELHDALKDSDYITSDGLNDAITDYFGPQPDPGEFFDMENYTTEVQFIDLLHRIEKMERVFAHLEGAAEHIANIAKAVR
jgi:hypothetical protein